MAITSPLNKVFLWDLTPVYQNIALDCQDMAAHPASPGCMSYEASHRKDNDDTHLLQHFETTLISNVVTRVRTVARRRVEDADATSSG